MTRSSLTVYFTKPRKHMHGMTLVELLVTITLVSILSLTLANFTASWLQQSVVTRARTDLLTDAQDALDFVNTDIRLSGAADENNRWPDDNAPNAPSNTLSWQSNASTLVLASVAQDDSGGILFSDPLKYVSEKNNQVYFVKSNTLYRRTLASDVASNRAVTTCPSSVATSACPEDRIIAKGVESFSVNYFDADGAEINPSSARSIKLSLSLATKKYGQTINVSDSTRMVFRND